ncbi:MAG TPA: histidine kinase dimerization/phospho-acceptor domain-containing protein [Terriglobales bacterium]|jgi:signal transduction histidine kinase|nr:histidine kinase dimerization/phospho-acceptor domain-containing protein [Terriglobales bacterium]
MNTGATRMVRAIERSALFGVADATLSERLSCASESYADLESIMWAVDLAELRHQLSAFTPRVILLDEEILAGAPLQESLRQLTEAAPVILVAPLGLQVKIARLVAEGDVDFVARAGDFASLAAGLVERRLRWAAQSETALGTPWAGLPADTADIFRHEINNPLTGILGNAELVLSHRDRLPPADAQRLQTVVDLAVRLRETTRRLSNAWEAAHTK